MFYYSGAIVLGILSLGQLELASLDTLEEKNRDRGDRWINWSIWLHSSFRKKALKAEYVILVGVLAWVGIGSAIFFVTRAPKQKSEQERIGGPNYPSASSPNLR